MSYALFERLRESAKKILKPKTRMNVVEWADTYRYLSPESSSSPGKWKTSRVEAARGPMLAVTDPTVKKITVMGPTQLLKTELINNIVGFFIHQDPSPMIVMQPTGSLAETWSKDRLDKMVRDTPVLSELIKPKKSRDSENTILHKSFPGGHITIVGSNSPSELASRPVRITLRDEVDKYPASAGDEGDPSSLIIERSSTFWNALDVGVCSPTIKGRSKIEQEYLLSDQRKFHVDCPHCSHNQFMVWENVRWFNNDSLTAQYECPECKVLWDEKERVKAISTGRYVATAPFRGHAGFHVNALASPWESLSVIVQKYLDAVNSGELEKVKAFTNTKLAETFEEKGEAPEYQRLYERRERYEINSAPEGVRLITAGVDVQKDRLELEIVGWGKGRESWSIDYRVIMGETSTPEPWKELDRVLLETWTIPNGRELHLRMLAVDSGYNTQHVYNWARKHLSTKVMVVKGSDSSQNILGVPQATDVTHDGKRHRRGVRVFPVGVSTIKSELYSFLNLNAAGDDGIYPPGYCHFPQYGEEYFKMLVAEQLVQKTVNGRILHRWVKAYERNEALDCRTYARAAANMLGMDRFTDKDWDRLIGMEETVKANKPKHIPEKLPDRKRQSEPEFPKPNSIWGNNKKPFW